MNKTVFLKVFGDYPLNKVLDFLAIHEDFDYPMKEISIKSNVGYSTLKLFWKDLVKHKIVIKTRAIGKAKLYKLNKNSPIVQKFLNLYWAVTEAKTKEYLEKEKIRLIAK